MTTTFGLASVDAASATGVSGTFAATVGNGTDADFVITEGSFNVPLGE